MTYVRPEIQAMSGYVPGEQPPAGKFIKLNTNENPYPPSPAAIRAVQQSSSDSLVRYPDATGTAFRIRAADILGVDPDWILCGNGSDDILTICTRAFVGQGQWLRVPYPSYILYNTLAQIQGAHAEPTAFESDWSLPDSFGQSRANLKLAFLPNPNSPSGTLVAADRILELADALPCPLLVDEAYVDFARENCLNLIHKSDKIMVSRTLSKSYGLAGLRFGFLVACPALIEQLLKVKDSYNCDSISLAAATAAIDDQSWLNENTAKVVATRTRMAAELRDIGFDVARSEANFVWCTHSGRAVQPIYEELKANRILVRYMDYPDWGEGLRISVGTDDQFDACLSLLKSML